MLLAAVGCLSLSSLCFELLITRFFSIAHGGHMSFVAVGVAMLGYAAGGTAHSLFEKRLAPLETGRAPRLISGLLLACGVCVIGSYCAVKALPLDYLKLPVQRAQWLFLCLTWVLLSLPFFVSGLASVAAYAMRPRMSGAISAASLLGSALGTSAPAALLPLAGEPGCVAVAAATPLLALLVLARDRAFRLCGLFLLAAVALLFAWQRSGFLAVEPSPYKTLPLLRQDPRTVVKSGEPGIRGTLDEVQSPGIRFAPGLSLGFPFRLPRQTGLIVDGDSMTVLCDSRAKDGFRFALWSHSFAPYVVAGGEAGPRGLDCLVLQRDGGLALACALASRPRSVVLVVEDPRIARRTSAWHDGQPLTIIADNPRSYIAGCGERFSTIVVEDWGSSLPGLSSLQADFLLTIDAVRAYWSCLTPRGVLAVSRRTILPPSDSLRVFSTFLSALEAEGVERPGEHLAVIRGWDSCTIIAARAAFGPDAARRLLIFAEDRSFDLDYCPGVPVEAANRFSRYESPLFAREYQAIVRDPSFAGGQSLDVAAQDDDRPFPTRFMRWSHARDFFRATGQRTYTLFLTGEVIAGAHLAQAMILAAALVTATVLWGRRIDQDRTAGSAPLLLMAASVGAGFMAAEMFVINASSLLFPSPTVALSISLGGLLLFSAIGGLASQRLQVGALGAALAAAALLLGACAVLLPRAFSLILPLPLAARIAASVGAMSVPGFLIGMPFPAVMRLLPSSARGRAEAWAVNGCASVLLSAASALIAPAVGNRSLLFIAGAAYACAAAAGFFRRAAR